MTARVQRSRAPNADAIAPFHVAAPDALALASRERCNDLNSKVVSTQ